MTRYYVYLDKVEKKKLAELQEKVPEYTNLGINDIAHLELKNGILGRLRQLAAMEKNKKTPGNQLHDAELVYTRLRLSYIIDTPYGSFKVTEKDKLMSKNRYPLKKSSY